jgi:scyllo-inosamine 4-kinase
VASIARLEGAGVLSAHQGTVLRKTLDHFWTALPLAPHVLNHGDFGIVNALWRDGQVVALLDFEFAIIAPVELDLGELVKAAFVPPEEDDPLPDPGGHGLQRLQEAVTEVAIATMQTPGGPARLLGYAILLELWSMENWLSKWDRQEPFNEWQPYRTLTSLADGAGGYLAPLLARLRGP